MKSIEKTFCKNLYKWQNASFEGTRKELGKFFNVSQGYISNIIAGRNCGDETWRRMVAKKIGMDYDTMIGINKTATEQNIIEFESRLDEKHFNVTKQFKNKPRAITINQNLIEIEAYDDEEIEEVKDNIERRLKKLRKKNKASEDRDIPGEQLSL